MDCKCVNAKVSVSGDVHAKVSIQGDTNASVSVGTVTIRDGTNNYEQLINRPRIEGVLLSGDKLFSDLGLECITPQEIDQIIFG